MRTRAGLQVGPPAEGLMQDDEAFAVLIRQTGLPLDDGHVATLREGYAHLQQLRAALQRPAPLDTDLAVAFVPEFGR